MKFLTLATLTILTFFLQLKLHFFLQSYSQNRLVRSLVGWLVRPLVTKFQPEHPKGAMDEVKRPEGPPTRSRGPEGPQTSSVVIILESALKNWLLKLLLDYCRTIISLNFIRNEDSDQRLLRKSMVLITLSVWEK